MGKKKAFILIGIFWLIIIIGFVVTKEFTLRTGRQILLKTVPVDPRDLFRGDYITLRYKISTLDLNKVPTDYVDFKTGNKIYLSLGKEDDYGVPLKIYRNSPEGKELFLKGRIKDAHGKVLTVEYGIESYFVPEGKGKEMERAGEKTPDVKISIDKFGNAAIKSLLMEGKEVTFK